MATKKATEAGTGGATQDGAQSAQNARVDERRLELMADMEQEVAETLSAQREAAAEFDRLTGAATQQVPATVHDRVNAIMRELNTTYLQRERVVRGMFAALVSGHHGVILGPPGEAKSRLVDDLRERVTGAVGFKLLMTRFTTPEEVFGPISLSKLQQDRYARKTAGYFSEAHIPFLDEPFKAGSSILNTLLQALNEREFRNDGTTFHIPLISMFGASNEMPQGEDLGALWDRMLLRFWVDPLRGADLRRFLVMKRTLAQNVSTLAVQYVKESTSEVVLEREIEASLAGAATITLDELYQLQREATAAMGRTTDRIFDLYEEICLQLARHGFKLPSTRRTDWCMHLVAAAATLGGRARAIEEDLAILGDALWDHVKEAKEVYNIVLHTANPRLAEAQEHMDTVLQVQAQAVAFCADQAQHPKAERHAKVVEARIKIAEEGDKLRRLCNEAKGEGSDWQAIDALIAQVKVIFMEVTNIMGASSQPWG